MPRLMDRPPPHGRNHGAYVLLLSPFMEHPGLWGVVRNYPNAKTASRIAERLRARIYTMPAGEWDFRVRGLDLWGCYLGPPPVADEAV